MSVIIALDYGIKKMGVAVGNTISQTAQPHTILPMSNGQPEWVALLKLIEDWQAGTILVGLPLNMDGSESHLSKRATKFAKRLNHQLKAAHIKVSMYMVDERLSSFEAKTTASKSQLIDDKAACVLLTSWFDNKQGMKLN